MNIKQIIALILLLCVMLCAGCTKPIAPETQPDTQAPTQEKDWESILTYSEYLKMTKDQQDAFYNSFEDPNDFFSWFDAAKKIYDEERKENHFDGGSIDVGGKSGD